MRAAATDRTWELLLACAHQAVWDRPTAGFVLGDRAWPEVIALADGHGLIPHLHRLLERSDAPADVRREVTTMARATTARSLNFTAELHRVLGALHDAGLEAVVLKGPALAMRLYGAVGMRQFSDLDLLVPPAAAAAAVEVVFGLGYRSVDPPGGGPAAGPPASPSAEPHARRQIAVLHETRQVHDSRRTAVEIHRTLTRRRLGGLADLDGCRERARPLEVGGRPVLDLADEDKILHLATHGLDHGWNRLGYVCDFARLVRVGAAIDWDAVAARARRVGGERILALALLLARDLVGVAPPITPPEPAPLRPLLLGLGRRLVARSWRRPGASLSRAAWHALALLLRERWRDKALLVLRTMGDPAVEDFDLLGLPASGRLLALAVRPYGLFRRHVLGDGRR